MPPTRKPGEASPALQQALRQFQAGKTVDAEETMLRAAREARSRFGNGSYPDAVAQNELGSILFNVGQLDRAIEAMRESVSGPPSDDPDQMRDRLTFLMNLGQTLQFARRFEEAEEVLHKGLEGRLSFYGREHAGYAFGLEPLAQVTMHCGKADVALEMIDEVVGNYWRNGHTRVAKALAIRAELRKAAGKVGPVFAGLEKLPPQIIEEVGKQAIAQIAFATDLKISRQVLADLAPLLAERLGEAHPQTVAALVEISNVESKLEKEGDPAIRIAALDRLLKLFDAQNRGKEAVRALLALALAHGDAGRPTQAVDLYQQALSRVEQQNDPARKSDVLRNYGLLLADLKQNTEAGQRLREAVTAAEASGDAVMLGLARVALGVFVQHAGQLDEARTMLEHALPMLDAAGQEAIICRSHLQALAAGSSCGCGDTTAAVADAFREYVLARLPEGLLQKLDVALEDRDFSIGVHLARDASQEELDRVNRVVEHALEEFRRRLL